MDNDTVYLLARYAYVRANFRLPPGTRQPGWSNLREDRKVLFEDIARKVFADPTVVGAGENPFVAYYYDELAKMRAMSDEARTALAAWLNDIDVKLEEAFGRGLVAVVSEFAHTVWNEVCNDKQCGSWTELGYYGRDMWLRIVDTQMRGEKQFYTGPFVDVFLDIAKETIRGRTLPPRLYENTGQSVGRYNTGDPISVVDAMHSDDVTLYVGPVSMEAADAAPEKLRQVRYFSELSGDFKNDIDMPGLVHLKRVMVRGETLPQALVPGQTLDAWGKSFGLGVVFELRAGCDPCAYYLEDVQLLPGYDIQVKGGENVIEESVTVSYKRVSNWDVSLALG